MDPYFERIGLARADLHGADLATLARVLSAHLQSIPFENLDIVLGKTIDMSLPAVLDKLVTRRRGGFCFEQNTLLLEGLRSLGFSANALLARVRWNRAPAVETPFTHMIVLVSLPEGEFVVDAGFGGLQCPTPLPVPSASIAQTSSDCGYRITPPNAEGYLALQWQLRGSWVDLYKFRNEPALPCDLGVANWFSCTAPGARWTSCLFAARMFGTARHHILGSELCVRNEDGSAVRTCLAGAESVLAHIRDSFGIELPPALCRGSATFEESALALVQSMIDRGTPGEAFHSAMY